MSIILNDGDYNSRSKMVNQNVCVHEAVILYIHVKPVFVYNAICWLTIKKGWEILYYLVFKYSFFHDGFYIKGKKKPSRASWDVICCGFLLLGSVGIIELFILCQFIY